MHHLLFVSSLQSSCLSSYDTMIHPFYNDKQIHLLSVLLPLDLLTQSTVPVYQLLIVLIFHLWPVLVHSFKKTVNWCYHSLEVPFVFIKHWKQKFWYDKAHFFNPVYSFTVYRHCPCAFLLSISNIPYSNIHLRIHPYIHTYTTLQRHG